MTYLNPAAAMYREPRPLYDYFNAPKRKGYNPNYPNGPAGHKGVDLYANGGTDAVSPDDMEITLAGRRLLNPSAGIHIEGFSDRGHRLLHLSQVLVSVGDHVSRGDVIGKVGCTGLCNSPHIHYGLYDLPGGHDPSRTIIAQGIPIDPWPHISSLPEQWVDVTCGRPMLRQQTPPYITNVHCQEMQHHLNRVGILDLTPGVNYNARTLEWDGKFGPSTKSAVETFQAAQGLTVDGIVGADTWTRLLDY